ncbi:MAG: alpha/beta hydrolase [Cyanobacteria bacterium P01_H01_bin.58]
MQSETCQIQPDLSLFYRTWGHGEPVLLLHGLADHGLVWRDIVASLSDRYRCIAPDLRGHGDSSKPPETAYDARLLATDLKRLTQQLELHQVHVVAHSWAAKVALLWAQAQPERLRSLVLVDPFFVNRLPGWLGPTLPLFYRTLPFLKIMGPFPRYEAAVTTAQSLKQYRGWSDLQASVFAAGMEQKADGTWGSKFAIAARNGVFQDVLRVAGLTRPVATPTCLILPTQGLNRLAWQLRPYQRYLTNLTVNQVPGNHWPHLVEPAALGETILPFLEQFASEVD